LGVVVASKLVAVLHHLLVRVLFEESISAAPWTLPGKRVMIVHGAGRLAYGVIAHFARKRWPGDIVDAIEANALYGGRMSLGDSLRLTLLTVLSAGVGASVGLEAAYTQLGAGWRRGSASLAAAPRRSADLRRLRRRAAIAAASTRRCRRLSTPLSWSSAATRLPPRGAGRPRPR